MTEVILRCSLWHEFEELRIEHPQWLTEYVSKPNIYSVVKFNFKFGVVQLPLFLLINTRFQNKKKQLVRRMARLATKIASGNKSFSKPQLVREANFFVRRKMNSHSQ